METSNKLQIFNMSNSILLCCLQSIAAHRDHFVRRLSVRLCVCLSVCLSGSHTFLVVTHSYVSQVTHAFLRMLPLCSKVILILPLTLFVNKFIAYDLQLRGQNFQTLMPPRTPCFIRSSFWFCFHARVQKRKVNSNHSP